MIGLGDLPLEIINNVCLHIRHVYRDPGWCYLDFSPYEYLSPDCRKAREDLLSLCLTSKALRKAAVPHLYHYIYIRDFDKYSVTLAESLLENKHLADLIKEIEIEPSISLRRSPIFVKHIAKQPLPRPPLRSGGTEEATEPNVKYSAQLLDFLLSSLRSLRILNVVVQYDLRVWDLFGAIRNNHGPNAHLFPKLEEINFRHKDTEGGFALSVILDLLALTKVSRCSFRMCTRIAWDTESKPTWNFSSLLELRISFSALDANDIKKLIAWCPNLELFRYELGNEQVAGYYDSGYADASDFSHALRPLRDKLRTLIMDFTAVHELEDDFRPTQSLVDFGKLEYLSMCSRSLTYCEVHQRTADSGSSGEYSSNKDRTLIQGKHGLWTPFLHKLPNSMQSLLITSAGELDDVEDVRQVLRHELSRLANITGRHFPHLKRVVVNAQLGLKNVFENKGVEYLEFANSPQQHSTMDAHLVESLLSVC